jgi:hypothetical protein
MAYTSKRKPKKGTTLMANPLKSKKAEKIRIASSIKKP